jgi:hypothetical protein
VQLSQDRELVRQSALAGPKPAAGKPEPGVLNFPPKTPMGRTRSRSRSGSLGASPKSPARDNRKVAYRNDFILMLKRTIALFSHIVFYIATVPESYKARRELFSPLKCFAILFHFLSTAAVLGFENQGIRFMGVVIGLVSLTWFLTIQFFSPKVIARADVQTKGYSGIHERTFARVYVADTGYKSEDGNPIYGLYASTFISAG